MSVLEDHSSLNNGGASTSYSNEMVNQESVDYFEWCTAFLNPNQHNHNHMYGHHGHVPHNHGLGHYSSSSSSSGSSVPMPTHPHYAPHFFNENNSFLRSLQDQHQRILCGASPLSNGMGGSNGNTMNGMNGINSSTISLKEDDVPVGSHRGLPLPTISTSGSTLSSFFVSPPPPLPPQPVPLHKTINIPEFTYAHGGSDGLQRPSDGNICQLQEPLHRNYYHTIQFRVPSAAYATSPNVFGNYESYRIYIHPELGYSGNAKRFKQAPEAGEKAFILEGAVLDQLFRPITQCNACEEYFENKSYFVANPHCKGRILLIKNNQVTRIKNNLFSLNLKPMCCSRHHQSPFYLHFVLRDSINFKIVMSTVFVSHVKQWKKTSSTSSAKRRKVSSFDSGSDSSSSPSSVGGEPQSLNAQ